MNCFRVEVFIIVYTYKKGDEIDCGNYENKMLR